LILQLPIDNFIKEIYEKLTVKQNLVVIATPGAGKTTRIPPNILPLTPLKILMLQPRRIAARASAERIAAENNWKLGHEVGYRVRFEDCTSSQTRLVVVTEALLMQELLKDPTLTEYGIVILDEFHERNLYTDAGLAAIRELQQLHRPDLKMIIMSATIDPIPLMKYLAPADLIQVPGRTFPVDIFYDKQSQLLNTNHLFIERVVSKIIEVCNNNDDTRHILVFLPGLSEIQRVQKALLTHPQWKQLNRNVFPLHGSLSLKEQHAVLQSNEPKIILATNVAETSLTIDGVDTVIDSGLSRELQWDQRRLFPWLKTSRISKASAEQRKGRAGRQFAGRCFRLWSKLDDQSMQNFAPPDISNQDLTDLTLTLIQLGISDPKNFSWFENPSFQNLERAIQFLFQLGLLKNQSPPFELTLKGEWIQQIPLGPRLASLIYEGVQTGFELLAIQIAVLLNERDPWSRENLENHLSDAKDSDLIPRLQALNSSSISYDFKTHEQSLRQLNRIVLTSLNKRSKNTLYSNHKSVSRIEPNPKILEPISTIDFKKDDFLLDITRLLLSSFSDRIARRRRMDEKTALVVGQKGVELSNTSLVRDAELFFCLQGHANESNGNAIVDLAHPLPKSSLMDFYKSEIVIKREERFYSEKDSWMSVEQKFFRDLPIEEPNIKPLTITKENLIIIAQQAFEKWKKTVPSLSQWYLRLELAKKFWPQLNWPELSHWEQDTLELACMGEKSLQNMQEKNWSELFCYPLSRDQQQILTIELPEFISTIKGKSLRLQYDLSGIVNLELKIQDAFGWKQTPKIAQGKIKLRLILLGPHMRPLQTTDDLASFWKGAYLEMRPSLKAKYHKHPWPEDPTL